LNYSGDKSGYDVFKWLAAILMIIWPIHYLISLKRFYSLSLGKAILKFVLINSLVMAVLLMLFILFILLSLFI
ncbi:MAG TPA: hypothetical protein VM935_07120, partial [Chitinophagaceae bacterium]|nr:hypothetical protein [Chitinophagaceae bacterium]